MPRLATFFENFNRIEFSKRASIKKLMVHLGLSLIGSESHKTDMHFVVEGGNRNKCSHFPINGNWLLTHSTPL
jgi:hypothetical protein